MKRLQKGLFLLLFVFSGIGLASNNARAAFYIVESIADRQTTKKQQTPVWCWAAAIEMVLASGKVMWSQVDIVNRVKGFPKLETASSGEITQMLNSWNFDYNGKIWRSKAKYYQGALPASVLIHELKNQWPVIVTYSTGPASGHAVVVYAALTSATSPEIKLIYYFDPFTGKKETVFPDEFKEKITNSWAVRVVSQ
ncbi:MAG: papain-like cysteine protease family protein [Hyphomicrobiaceae bacterium]